MLKIITSIRLVKATSEKQIAIPRRSQVNCLLKTPRDFVALIKSRIILLRRRLKAKIAKIGMRFPVTGVEPSSRVKKALVSERIEVVIVAKVRKPNQTGDKGIFLLGNVRQNKNKKYTWYAAKKIDILRYQILKKE
jgi:hypothetical protein